MRRREMLIGGGAMALWPGTVGARWSDRRIDTIFAGGLILDGSGADPFVADIGVAADRIVAVGDLRRRAARRRIDITGRAISPGFINLLSWSDEIFLSDGRGLSELKQGVTSQIMGEGWSMGPFNDRLKREHLARPQTGAALKRIPWTTLAQYLTYIVGRGLTQNVGSLVGATIIRQHVLGDAERAPTQEQLATMTGLVEAAMRAGALGVGSALIYPPASYAQTGELIALARASARYGGCYASHIRSEGDKLLEAIDEAIAIARSSGATTEIYHLKVAGTRNWSQVNEVLARIEKARSSGLDVAANMYLYPAGGTSLSAVLPPWAQEGGREAMLARLGDPALRARASAEIGRDQSDWENLYRLSGGPARTQISTVQSPELKPLVGLTIAEVAQAWGRTPEDTIVELVLRDGGWTGALFFFISEENIERQLRRPWISLGSDAAAMPAERPHTDAAVHPRGYGNFARLFARYVRDRQVLSLPEAVRRVTSLPASRMRLSGRGRIAIGAYADLVVFDPANFQDHATFAQPHRYATGMDHVMVNGRLSLESGEVTEARPGRVLIGPGAMNG